MTTIEMLSFAIALRRLNPLPSTDFEQKKKNRFSIDSNYVGKCGKHSFIVPSLYQSIPLFLSISFCSAASLFSLYLSGLFINSKHNTHGAVLPWLWIMGRMRRTVDSSSCLSLTQTTEGVWGNINYPCYKNNNNGKKQVYFIICCAILTWLWYCKM